MGGLSIRGDRIFRLIAGISGIIGKSDSGRLHPEAKHGAVRAHAANKAMGHNVADNLSATFTAETARATGRDARTVRRKEIYEALHPEAKAQVRQGLIRQGAAADNLSAAFTTETARATGRDARTVRRKEIYEALHPEAKAQVRQANARWNADDNLSPAFAAETARATGKSERARRCGRS